MLDEKGICELIQRDVFRMQILNTVAELHLSDWWIGAGFVRNAVWDYLLSKDVSTPLNDVDVIYFDPHDIPDGEMNVKSTSSEDTYEKQLRDVMPLVKWSVKNQARMHLLHNDEPYSSSEDALSHWVETATCVGIKLDQTSNLKIIAPYGIDDLVSLRVRPTEYFKNNLDEFYRRIEKKNWLSLWPKLVVYKE